MVEELQCLSSYASRENFKFSSMISDCLPFYVVVLVLVLSSVNFAVVAY